MVIGGWDGVPVTGGGGAGVDMAAGGGAGMAPAGAGDEPKLGPAKLNKYIHSFNLDVGLTPKNPEELTSWSRERGCGS